MHALSFDFETYPIAPGLPHPPPVCMSYQWIDLERLETCGDAQLVTWREGCALLDHCLTSGVTLVGANTAFDAHVHMLASADPEACARLWIGALESARVTDVLLRQRLLCGATDQGNRLFRHSLASVYEHWTGKELMKDDEIRLSFGELDGLAIDAYPHRHRDYALDDAIATAEIYLHQERERRGLAKQTPDFSGAHYVDYHLRFPGRDLLADQYRQTCKAFGLADMSAAGMITDARTVDKFERQLVTERNELLQVLVPAGLVSVVYALNVDAIVSRFARLGITVPRTAAGRPSLTQRVYAQAAYLDRELSLTCRGRTADAWPASASELARVGSELVNVRYKKNESRVRLAVELVYLHLDGETPNRTEKKDPVTRRVTYGDVKIDADNCDRSGHPTLAAFARYASVSKTLAADVPLMRAASREPFHAHYTTLKANGRTATGSEGGAGAAGNVQNMPRTPGVRECWVAPAGWVIAEADSAAVELSSFGQVCLWWLGWSDCATMIQQGIDQHAVAGAMLDGIPDPRGAGWRELKKRIKQGDKVADDRRTAGKGMNFGLKGKMSAARYQAYAWNNYGLKITLEEARRCVAMHDEMIREMPHYSAYVEGAFAREPGNRNTLYDVVHPWSLRCRAGLAYTDAHNYPFSGLAQDMAGVAIFELYKARWGASTLGTNDPLYRCRPFLFAHDSYSVYVPDEPTRADAAARRIGEIVTAAARFVMPDVGSKAEPTLSRQLSKKVGDATFDEHGRVKIWDAWEACANDARNDKRPPNVAVRQWLESRKWPRYIIEDILEKGLQ